MNILILSHLFPTKTAPSFGIFVLEQVKALDKLRVNTEIISPIPYSPKILWFSKKWRNYGKVTPEEILSGKKVLRPRYLAFPRRLLFERSGWFYYIGIKKTLKEILNKKNIELIHAHTALPDGQAALYIKKEFNIRFVLTIHGDDLYNTIHQSNLRRNSIREVIENSDKTVVVGNTLKDSIKKNFTQGFGEKIITINNGVDLNKFNFGPRSFPKHRNFVILSVGSLIQRKGHEGFLEVLGKLAKRFPIEYQIIGDGPERSNLEKVSKEKKLNKIVKFLGHQSHEEISKFYKKADLFVLPSWDEAFGVVYLEAMATGLPVIGCKGQGIEDVVEDGKEGFLVKPRDSDSLLTACEKIISDENLFEFMSKRAFQVAKKFSWHENARRTLEVYREVLAKKTQP